ncbi:A disintegrin and metalloproteinase with thrombospondin motifs 6-like [Tachypleus tridentatus]|uniref:A disintegrin and metalloproteinase with thrombospondin motifs 6-like n=1 Tax=Tachypleus tridentatus TaxID=6853 RepID=UPI003FD41E5B
MILTSQRSSLILVAVALEITTFVIGNKSSYDDEEAENSRHLYSYEIIIPHQVTANGNFLSYGISHGYSWNYFRRRRRRSLAGEQEIFYKLPIKGEEIRIHVRPNYRYLSPALKIEHRSSKLDRINETRVKAGLERTCYFVGSVHNVSNSLVSVSTCSGMRGLIRIGENHYFIEPLKGHEVRKDSKHPHIIYKRETERPQFNESNDNISFSKGTCGNDDSDKENIGKRQLWERKHTARSPVRTKRSVSKERNVETLVVVDKKMKDFYHNDDVETYVLTIMNMVSSLYHDATIGNAINIVLVRVIILDEHDDETKDLEINHNANSTLKSFCKWQQYVNFQDENHPNHHDVAILLTRYNICTKGNQPCSTLGLAEVAGMCQPGRSCNVNEDTGLAVAYTIAHEMGHNFGMSHDSFHNGCQLSFEEQQHIMSSHFASEASPVVWSKCSRSEITKFLDRDWGRCLDDEPSDHDFSFPQLPPGTMYNADHQCRLQYGHSATHCTGLENMCQTLWCRVDDKCVTRLEPAADGTICGLNKWCFMGKCITIEDQPNSIDGEWGSWGSWSLCSRSCGGGTMSSERLCNNPPPTRGGKYCTGERRRVKLCNIKTCPEGSPSFRGVQCSNFDDLPYKGKLHKWFPVYSSLKPCQLHCKAEGEYFSVLLADTVEDGTPCNPGTKDVCVDGKCRFVGCDGEIDSKSKEDRCGICHGDGTQCDVIRDVFKQKRGLGYAKIVTVPQGARNIRVEELSTSNNYLALRDQKGYFHLNGDWFVQWSGEYEVAGTTFTYTRIEEKESLVASGPLKKDVEILLLFQDENLGVSYEYTVPNKHAIRKPQYIWEMSDWSICSVTCGTGKQISKVFCAEKISGRVEDKFCSTTVKPLDKVQECNIHDCPPRWWAGPWQQCSVTCGKLGFRLRTILCVQFKGNDEQIALADDHCEGQQKPKKTEACRHDIPCPGEGQWSTGPWSDTCLNNPCGYQSRQVFCSLPNGGCNVSEKPITRKKCSNQTCGVWMTGKWSQCSVTCGEGIQFRKVRCRGQVCSQSVKPPSSKKCFWYACNLWAVNKVDTSTDHPDSDQRYTEENSIFENNKIHKHRHRHGNNVFKRKHRLKTNFGQMNPGDWITSSNLEPVVKDSSQSEYSEHTSSEKPAPNQVVLETDMTPGLNTDLWKTGHWSQCSTTCGEGSKHRSVTCPWSYRCDVSRKPVEVTSCFLRPCGEWKTESWGQCSVTCGRGYQVRHVYCENQKTSEETQTCSLETKPKHWRNCDLPECIQRFSGLTRCENHLDSALCWGLRHQCRKWRVWMRCCGTCRNEHRRTSQVGRQNRRG